MPAVGVLYALVPADDLEDLRGSLRRRLYADEIVVHDVAPGTYRCVDDRLGVDLRWARRGAVLGAVIGAMVGVAVAGIVGAVSTAIFGLFAGGGAALAGLIGAVTGMQLHEVLDDDPPVMISVDGADPRRVLEVRSEHNAAWARRTLRDQPSVCFLESRAPADTERTPI